MLFRKILIPICIILLILSKQGAAQSNGIAPSWEWTKTFSVNNDSNKIRELIVHDDYLYAWGTFNSTLFSVDGINPIHADGLDLFVAKWDTIGNLIWIQSIRGIGDESGAGLVFDDSGDLLIAGSTNSPSLQVESTLKYSFGSTDAFLVKLNPASGNLIRLSLYGNSNYDEFSGICVGGGMTYISGTVNNINGIHMFNNNGDYVSNKSLNNSFPIDIHYSNFDSTIVCMGFIRQIPNQPLTFTLDGITLYTCNQSDNPTSIWYLYKMHIDHSMGWLKNVFPSVLPNCNHPWGYDFNIEDVSGKLIPLGGWIGMNALSVISADTTLQYNIPYQYVKGESTYFSTLSIQDSLMVFGHADDGQSSLVLVNLNQNEVIKHYKFPAGSSHFREKSCFPVYNHASIYAGGFIKDSSLASFSLGKINTLLPDINLHTLNHRSQCLNSQLNIYPEVFGGTPPYQYNWSPSYGLSSTNTLNTEITFLASTVYTLTVTDSMGRSCSKLLHIDVDSFLQAEIFSSDSLLCNDAIVLLPNFTIDDTVSGFWTFSGSVEKIYLDTLTVQHQGVYTIHKNNGSCAGSEDSIFIQKVPQINITPPPTVCYGDSLTLTANGATKYNWNMSVINGISFFPTDNTIYTVIATDANGCISTSSVFVKVLTPSVTIPVTEICRGDVIIAKTSYDTDSLIWKTEDSVLHKFKVGYDTTQVDTLVKHFESENCSDLIMADKQEHVYFIHKGRLYKAITGSFARILVAGTQPYYPFSNNIIDAVMDEDETLFILDKHNGVSKRIKGKDTAEILFKNESMVKIVLGVNGDIYTNIKNQGIVKYNKDHWSPSVVAFSDASIDDFIVDEQNVVYGIKDKSLYKWVVGDTLGQLIQIPGIDSAKNITHGPLGDILITDIRNHLYAVRMNSLSASYLWSTYDCGKIVIDPHGNLYYTRLIYSNLPIRNIEKIKAHIEVPVTATKSGFYYFESKTLSGCSRVDSVYFYVSQNPVPVIQVEYPDGITSPTNLYTNLLGTHFWTYNNQQVTNQNSNQISYLGNGLYQVTVIDSIGCKSVSPFLNIHITEDWYVTPNPFTDELLLTLHIPENEIISCTLFDGLGNIIKKTPDQFDVLKGMHVYHFTHLENLPHGVYFLQVILSEERRVFKVVK